MNMKLEDFNKLKNDLQEALEALEDLLEWHTDVMHEFKDDTSYMQSIEKAKNVIDKLQDQDVEKKQQIRGQYDFTSVL